MAGSGLRCPQRASPSGRAWEARAGDEWPVQRDPAPWQPCRRRSVPGGEADLVEAGCGGEPGDPQPRSLPLAPHLHLRPWPCTSAPGLVTEPPPGDGAQRACEPGCLCFQLGSPTGVARGRPGTSFYSPPYCHSPGKGQQHGPGCLSLSLSRQPTGQTSCAPSGQRDGPPSVTWSDRTGFTSEHLSSTFGGQGVESLTPASGLPQHRVCVCPPLSLVLPAWHLLPAPLRPLLATLYLLPAPPNLCFLRRRIPFPLTAPCLPPHCPLPFPPRPSPS